MNLDQFLKTKGVCGSRTKNALASVISRQGWTKVPNFSAMDEMIAKIKAEDFFKTGKCDVRNLGRKGLLLLAEYFKIQVPQKDTSVNSLRQKLARANKRIAELERGEYICQKYLLKQDGEKVKADF